MPAAKALNASKSSNTAGVAVKPARGRAAPSADELVPIVYEQLRALAGSYLKREKIDISLEPGMLVNETYLRLRNSPEHSWVDQKHFLAVAAIAMRRVLVDHARKRRALKRGYGHARVGMDHVASESHERTVGITEIDEALRKLELEHPRQAKIVELRFFAGLNHEQISTVLDVSRKTVVADWGKAREWLANELA
jgi:RNA polymerase sigma-70 factor, ECF subfamily